MEAELRVALAKILPKILKKHKAIAAYLYGSYAIGRQHNRSDLDIGILFGKKPSVSVLAEISRKLQITGIHKEVDVRDLNTPDIVFLFEVLRNGILVYDGNPEKRKSFEIFVNRKYLDMKPHIQEYYAFREKRLEA